MVLQAANVEERLHGKDRLYEKVSLASASASASGYGFGYGDDSENDSEWMDVCCLHSDLTITYADNCVLDSSILMTPTNAVLCRRPEDEAPVVHEFDFGITIEDESVIEVDNTHVAEGLRRQYEAATVVEDAPVDAGGIDFGDGSDSGAAAAAAPEKSVEELMAEMNSL